MLKFKEIVEKYLIKEKYEYREFHEGLARAFGKDMERGYIDQEGNLVISLTDKKGNILFASKDDIDWDNATVRSYEGSAKRMKATYYFGGDDFFNGVALITWTILPDGLYFADEDGFGAEDNDEINLFCYINNKGKVIIPFQSMTNEQILHFRKIAENIVSSSNSPT